MSELGEQPETAGTVREATQNDLPALLALAAERRTQLAQQCGEDVPNLDGGSSWAWPDEPAARLPTAMFIAKQEFPHGWVR